MSESPNSFSIQQILLRALLLLGASVLAYLAVFYLAPTPSTATDLKIGSAAPEDILAPNTFHYTSEVLTEQMRETAARNVSPKYTSAATDVARKQLEILRAALAYISSVRADPYASEGQKLADLAALQYINLNQENATAILRLTDSQWQAIQQEAISVLEQVMRETIRENQVEAYRASVPNRVSLALPPDQAELVADLVAAAIAPNSFYSESLTETARQQAAESVEPVVVSYVAGEKIVERGEIITELDIEALQHAGLAEPETRWQDYASPAAVVLLSACLMVIFLRSETQLLQSLQSLFILAVLFLGFLAVGRLTAPVHPLALYVYPLAAYGLTVAGLFGAKTALVTLIPLILLTTFEHTNSSELILYYGVGTLFGVLLPRREQRITSYVWIGLSVAAAGATVITAYRLADQDTTAATLASFAAAALLQGIIAAGLTVLMEYLLAPLLGQTTPLQLLELSRPDHPLLEYLLHNAPGTYQHSLQVANLAEQAAERIDADSLLTRVGALYHDIGKAQNPHFFIENQAPGQLNTHDQLDPADSATVIKQHVLDGIQLCKAQHIPKRIQDFIYEHHGTNRTNYQWTQAMKNAGGDESALDSEKFRYPGPRPQSRETALVMLADGCEARVRAKRPKNEAELRAIIKDTIDSSLASGQLDDTPLTLKDLTTIADSFTATLRGIYHPRIEYPTLDIPTRPTHQQLEEGDASLTPPDSGDDSPLASTSPKP